MVFILPPTSSIDGLNFFMFPSESLGLERKVRQIRQFALLPRPQQRQIDEDSPQLSVESFKP